MYLSSREMEYHTMTTRTRASMARSFQPAGHTHRGAGGRNRRARPQSTFSHLPPFGPLQPPTQADPVPGPHFLAWGLDLCISTVLQDEEQDPGSLGHQQGVPE